MPQFNQSEFNLVEFGAPSLAGDLQSKGTSTTYLGAVRRRRSKSVLSTAGHSSIALSVEVNLAWLLATAHLSQFNQFGFNQKSFGSQEVGNLRTDGYSRTSIGVFRICRRALASSGHSTTFVATPFRRRSSPGSSLGHSATGIPARKRKPAPLSSHGTSVTAATHIRRRSLFGLRSSGSSSERMTVVHKAYRALHSAGSSHTSARLIRLALPPPATMGMRVGAGIRPSPKINLRTTPAGRPTNQANLRFTSWTAPV